MVIGPALGGLVISALGLTWAYASTRSVAPRWSSTVLPVAPQPPHEVAPHERLRDSIVEGLRYVRGNQALLGSFAIDLVAMTFGMPRALFAVLSVGVYHTGAAARGAVLGDGRRRDGGRDDDRMAAARAPARAGGDLGRGRLGHDDRLRRLAHTLWLAATLFALAGAADSVSAVCRTTINQTVTPERMRGRMSAVYSLVVSSGPRSATSSPVPWPAPRARFSVFSGGVLCLIGVAAIVVGFPALLRYDAEDWIAAPVISST